MILIHILHTSISTTLDTTVLLQGLQWERGGRRGRGRGRGRERERESAGVVIQHCGVQRNLVMVNCRGSV